MRTTAAPPPPCGLGTMTTALPRTLGDRSPAAADVTILKPPPGLHAATLRQEWPATKAAAYRLEVLRSAAGRLGLI